MDNVIPLDRTKKEFCISRVVTHQEYYIVEALTESEAIAKLESDKYRMRVCYHIERTSETPYRVIKKGEI